MTISNELMQILQIPMGIYTYEVNNNDGKNSPNVITFHMEYVPLWSELNIADASLRDCMPSSN